MNIGLIEKYNSYLRSHSEPEEEGEEKRPLRAVAISREAGSGAVTVAEILLKLIEQDKGLSGRPWTLFEKNLIQRVLKENQLPERLGKFMPEDVVGRMTDFSEEAFGLHPPTSLLVKETNKTIFRLAAAGNVILVGRGSHLITAPLKHVLKVRLIAPLEFKIRNIQRYFNLNREEAAESAVKLEKARVRYLRRHFSAARHDPLQFHMILNTGELGFTGAAELIVQALRNMKTAPQIEEDCSKQIAAQIAG